MRVLLLLLLVLPLFSGHYDDDTKKPKEDYDDEWMDVGEEEFKKQEHHFVHENRPPTDQPPAKNGDDKELELMDQQIKRNFRLRRELGINMDGAYDDSWMGNDDKEMDAELDLTERSGEGLGWCENPGKYLGGYSSGVRKYDDLETAQSECLLRNDCGGITYEVGSKKYTLRRGTTPKDSPSGEVSWTRCVVGCSEVYEAEVDSLAEQITEAITGKDLGLVKSYLNSTEGSLAVFKHDLLSRMAEAGDCIDLDDEVYQWIMSNRLALETFMTSGDVPDKKLAASMEILKKLIIEDPDITTSPLYLRLAVATAVTHSTPVVYMYNPYKIIDPIQRYLDFKEFSLVPEYLFEVFFKVSAWHLRYVVGSWQSKGEFAWARENTAEGYATPEKIGSATYQVMEYKLKNTDGISVHSGKAYYYYYPITMQSMADIGGVCGAISKVGAGFCHAYGVPAMPVGQPGHCAFIVYKNDHWALRNDVSGWASTNTHGGIQYSWMYKSYYVIIMDLAQKNPGSYRLSEKMRLASYFAAPKDRFLIIEDATTVNPYNFALWVEMKEAISVPDLDKGSVLKALLPTLEESRAAFEEVRNLASEKKISSECFGSTSSAMVDIDGSTAYCAEETAEFEIDIEKPSVVNEIRIQWWGWSKAAEYDIYAKNEFEEGSEYVKFLDQSDEKVDGWFNHWSYIGQIEDTVITKLKFELRNGRLDPWPKKYYFGIRHLKIIGISSEVVVDVTKKMKVSPDAAALLDEDPTTTWSGKDFEVELTGICDIETVQFQWDKEPMSIALTYSVGDDDLGEVQGTEPFENVSISDFASSIKVDISGEDAVLKGITGKGTRYGAKDILKQKVDLFYEDHSFVRTYISDSISEFDYED